MRRVISISVLLALNLFQLSYSQPADEQKLLSTFHTVSGWEMMDWIEKLCSHEFNGRLSGTPEYIASAEWVAANLKEWGLKPGGENGTYFQWFNAPYTVVNDPGGLVLNITQKDGSLIKKHYTYPAEYYPGMNSGSGEITAEVVFAGFGVSAPELNYDDYSGIDVKGKIVLINRDVPHTDPRNPEYGKWVAYCYHQYKLENAVRHGAAGFLYVDGASANPNISYDPSIIVCGIGRQPLEDIFAGLKTTNEELTDKIRKSFKPASFNTGKTMTIRANTTRHPEGKACNVIGIIEGTDPVLKNESIIIGAHLDAVGNAGKVVNGALDNASGVVDIMAAAKAMARSGIQLKRSVVFLFIGGEETGLHGSRLYASKPSLPAEKAAVYINLDMVGNGTGLAVSGQSTYKQLLAFFEDANSKYIHRPFRASAPEPSEYYGRPRSDSFNFSTLGYRTMSVSTTGTVKPVFYHLPGDDPDAVTIDIMEDVAKMLYVGLVNMANADSLK
ncbi:MAG: M20/M25/M40 family metallo-hydrolase [Bacteroidales bacterium]|nr:M20/M25/M40 family metallo-hydrolase [Bacteroidales bacterium]